MTSTPSTRRLIHLTRWLIYAQVAAEHLAPRVVSFDEATGLYGVDCRVTVEDGSVVRMAVERDFTDFVRCRTGLVEKLATTAHGRTLVSKLNKVPKKRVRSLLKAKARDAVRAVWKSTSTSGAHQAVKNRTAREAPRNLIST